MSKNKCRWCGVGASKRAVSYSCGSWHTYEGCWTQGVACRDLGEQLRLQHEQTIESLRQRIDALQQQVRDAVGRLEVLDRVNFYDDANYVWNAIAVTQILLKKAVGNA